MPRTTATATKLAGTQTNLSSKLAKLRGLSSIRQACSKGWSVCPQILLRLQWFGVLQALES